MANSDSKEKSTLLAKLKEATFFVAIYLYFTGFTYIYYFYDNFGIPLRVIDTPVYYFFVYSYNVVLYFGEIDWPRLASYKPTGIFYTLIGLTLVVMILKRKTKKNFLLFAGLVSLFPVLAFLAIEAADVEAKQIRAGLTGKTITFMFKEGAGLQPPTKVLPRTAPDLESGGKKDQRTATEDVTTSEQEESAVAVSLDMFMQANKRTDLDSSGDYELPKLYLITETSSSFYVLYQPRYKGNVYSGYVFEVPKSDIRLSTWPQVLQHSDL